MFLSGASKWGWTTGPRRDLKTGRLHQRTEMQQHRRREYSEEEYKEEEEQEQGYTEGTIDISARTCSAYTAALWASTSKLIFRMS